VKEPPSLLGGTSEDGLDLGAIRLAPRGALGHDRASGDEEVCGRGG
jgi:hypothetical protein